MDFEEKLRMIKNWRGRRLVACQAFDDIIRVIEALGEDDGRHPPPSDSEPLPVNDALKDELVNSAANLMRLILLHNDGQISPSKLNRF